MFTSVFKEVVKEGRKVGAKSLQLYVEKENHRAIKTY